MTKPKINIISKLPINNNVSAQKSKVKSISNSIRLTKQFTANEHKLFTRYSNF
ncbi:hypothetical protein AAJ76_3400038827 [Vairimorpha ceranae]|uniref:Uncharacterized protein n=1 Tax=Vairimorpha ceranae TaxID=40302 RepID=A0A0F9WQ36_9MICR|nr:hypothetical protein AAJ76_3400038827 [Vairimorpha ceranae]KKO75068.1 hypothetical protein AAJ76_3400038827 [Vairimorpha ceranae]